MAPLNFLSRMIQYYIKDPKKDLPIISTSTAAYLSISYTLLYVIPFYLSSRTRPSPQLPRDAPSVIRARIRAVTFSCIVICCITSYVALQYGEFSPSQLFRLFGLWPISVIDLPRTFLLVVLLYSGPLFERGIVEGELRDWIRGRTVLQALSTYAGWRTYVVGPISEEFVWRAMIIPLHLFAKVSATRIVFITPLYFGIAHVHHCYEYKLTHPNTPLLPAILRSLFQFTYTSIFGFYAAFIFLRTGNLLAAILTHSFCNWLGLPRVWGRLEVPVLISPPDLIRKEDVDFSLDNITEKTVFSHRKSNLSWSIAYYLLLVIGATGFYRNLFALTESKYAFVPR